MFQTLQRWLGQQSRRSARPQRLPLRIESLDERITPSASVTRWGGSLIINGDRADDHVIISSSGSSIMVDVNGASQSFDSRQIRGIVFRGGDGSDSFQNSTSLNSIADGGNGNDTLSGGSGNDLLMGGNGDDSVQGGSGRDRISGGQGNDDLNGDTGDDRLTGGSGLDQLNGGQGNDDLNGEAGDDSLQGEIGDDSLWGGSGDDSIDGGSGRDRLRGGSGQNSSVFDSDDLTDDTREHHGARSIGNFAKVEGTISTIDGNNVTIRTRSGTTVTINVTETTNLEINGAHVALSAFTVGMRAEAKFDPTTFAAFELESGSGNNGGNGGGQNQGSQFEGSVIAVGTDSVTLRSRGGAELTVTVNSATKIERNDQHVSLASILVGDRGEVRYDPATLIAFKVEAEG